MNKIISKKIIFCLLIGSSFLYRNILAQNSDVSASNINVRINSVTIGHDIQPLEASTIINLTNIGHRLLRWQLGFSYAQIPYVKLAPTSNPNLVMKICNQKNNCAALNVQRASNVKSKDLSVGYTTILAPSNNFPLNVGQTYNIQLLHSNQGEPGNYSGVPQNFFLLTHNGQRVTHLYTIPRTYILKDYDQKKVNQEITRHVKSNWDESLADAAHSQLIVPEPVSYRPNSNNYTFIKGVVIHNLLSTDNSMANLLQADLNKDLKISAQVNNLDNASGITIQKISDPSIISNNPEGYQIHIQHEKITISVLGNAGLFYALQTLRQLWSQSTTVNGAIIIDYPRFKYRGLMIDTARHFLSINEIEKIIDLMAIHKLNTLHIHFGDDEGFRLNIVGNSSMGGTRGYGQSIGPLNFSQGNLDITNYLKQTYTYADTIYKNFYSVGDLKQLIKYANVREITIVPEIDLPGHARALIKSSPDNMIDPNDHSRYVSIQGYTDDVIPVCTYNTNHTVGPQFTRMINYLVNQMALIFDHQSTLYARNDEISIGADEVSPSAWSNDSSCSGEWAHLNSLQKSQKFFQMMASTNSALLLSGWQQLVQTDDIALARNIVPADQTGHIWIWSAASKAIPQAISLAKNNYPIVLAFADETYMDLVYSPDITEPGFAWATQFSDTQAALSSAKSANAVLKGLASNKQANVLGIEGTLWSENLATYQHLIYMALPKMAGLAEASWSPASVTAHNNQIDWRSLAHRLGCGSAGFLAYLNKLYGVHYRGYPNGINKEVPVGVC